MSATLSLDRRLLPSAAAPAGAATTAVRRILRGEGLALFVAATAAYARLDLGWGEFALLFLAPDVSCLGYLAGPRWGAAAYNLAHSTILPLLLVGVGVALGLSPLIAIGLIALAHIGFDRALGYGLKYPSRFQDTHLGPLGRKEA